MSKEDLRSFLNEQKLMAIATSTSSKGIWIANVYYAIDKDLNFYFLSEPDTRHCQDLKENKEVAIAIAKFAPDNLSDRVGVQIVGEAERIKNFIDMGKALSIYTSKFISSGGIITIDNIKHKIIRARPYIVRPKLIKFMNDKLYGNFGTETFEF